MIKKLRAPLVLAVMLSTSWAPPRIVMFHGGFLENRIYLTNLNENQLFIAALHHADAVDVQKLKERPYADVTFYWLAVLRIIRSGRRGWSQKTQSRRSVLPAGSILPRLSKRRATSGFQDVSQVKRQPDSKYRSCGTRDS
ncbi:MAG: hypothetical protein ACRENP_14090 [Longimicrobiales bacterium]